MSTSTVFTRSANSKQQSLTQTGLAASKSKASSLSSVASDGENRVESLDDLLSRLQTMFDNTNEKIEQSKSELRNEISTLREDVQQFKATCSTELKQLSESIFEVRCDAAINRERILCAEKINDLLLSGVPFVPTENIDHIVFKTAVALGYEENDIPLISAKRLARPPIASGSAPPVALQFAFKFARDEFYSRYLRSRKLSLEHLGFNVNKRIYLNENLTELARKIKTQAVKLKKAGKLQSVFTKDGAVFVKVNSDAVPQMIHNLDELNQ